MKKINHFLLTGIIIGFIGLVGCGDDDTPQIDPVDAVTDRLTKTWVIDANNNASTVIFGSEDRTAHYTTFQLTFNEASTQNTYETVEVDVLDPWPISGIWEFTNPQNITDPNQNAFSITRGDGLVMSATLSNDSQQLELNFTFDQNAHDGTRTMAVDGQWTFVLVAQ